MSHDQTNPKITLKPFPVSRKIQSRRIESAWSEFTLLIWSRTFGIIIFETANSCTAHGWIFFNAGPQPFKIKPHLNTEIESIIKYKERDSNCQHKFHDNHFQNGQAQFCRSFCYHQRSIYILPRYSKTQKVLLQNGIIKCRIQIIWFRISLLKLSIFSDFIKFFFRSL